MLEIRVLGPIGARVAAEAVRITSPTQRLILAALARQPATPVSRDRLADLVWGQDPPDSVEGALKSHVSRLRRALEHDVIEARGGGYALTLPETGIDASCFGREVADATTLEELDAALARWRGTPFGEFAEEPFFSGEVRRLTDLHLHARQRRAALLRAADRHDEAAAALETVVADAPLREPAWILLIEILADAGRQADAVEAARRYREHVAAAGLEPSPRFGDLERAVFAGDRRSEPGPGAVALPEPMVELVGRDDELAVVRDLLRERRLVTLVGAGGVGKTSLAIEAGRAVAGSFPDGASMTRLVEIDRPEAVVPAVARAVGAPTTDPIERALQEFLAGRRALLLLDGAEHLQAEVRRTARGLVEAAGQLCVLTTSRRPLELPGEVVVRVEPLERDAAVELLSARAREAGVAIGPQERERAADVCERLDCLPLALEMAAGRLRGLGLDDLAARLDERLTLLRTGDGGRSLDEVVRWSHDLLTESRQRLLAHVSVFTGPFTLDAAAAVCGIDEDDIGGGIADLVDVSLLRRRGDGRYVLLETVRAFAAERLAALGEADGVTRRFVHHHADLARRIQDRLEGGGTDEGATRFTADLPNLAAAHGHALARDDLDAAAVIAAAPYILVYQRLRADVAGWAEATLPRLTADHPLRPAVAAVVALNRLHRGDPTGAERLLTDLPDAPVARHGHEVLGDLNLYRGDLDRARHHFSRAATLASSAGDDFTHLFARISSALAAAYGGDTARALTVLGKVRRAAPASGGALLAGWIDYAEAEIRAEDDPDRALELVDAAVKAADRAGWSVLAGVGRLTAGSVRARTADPAAALVAFRRLIEHWEGLGDETHQWTTLRNLVELLTRIGADEPAARLAGAVAAAPTPTYGRERDRLDAAARRLRQRLGTEVFEAARHTGSEMDLRAAVREALAAIREAQECAG